jgi:hypothetical protein
LCGPPTSMASFADQRENYQRFRLHTGGDPPRGRAVLVRACAPLGPRSGARSLHQTVL